MRLSLAALAVLAFTPPLAAQGPRAALEQIGPGKSIRISVDGRRLDGRSGGLDGEVLLLGAGDSRQRIPIGGIDTLWQRKGAYGTGALIGGVVGAAVFTGFLHLAVGIACESADECDRDHRRAWGYGIVLGGAGGGLLGAGVGGLVQRWDRILPR